MNFVAAVAYQFCLALPVAFTQLGGPPFSRALYYGAAQTSTNIVKSHTTHTKLRCKIVWLRFIALLKLSREQQR